MSKRKKENGKYAFFLEYSRKSNPKNVWPLKKAASLCTGIANHAI